MKNALVLICVFLIGCQKTEDSRFGLLRANADSNGSGFQGGDNDYGPEEAQLDLRWTLSHFRAGYRRESPCPPSLANEYVEDSLAKSPRPLADSVQFLGEIAQSMESILSRPPDELFVHVSHSLTDPEAIAEVETSLSSQIRINDNLGSGLPPERWVGLLVHEMGHMAKAPMFENENLLDDTDLGGGTAIDGKNFLNATGACFSLLNDSLKNFSSTVVLDDASGYWPLREAEEIPVARDASGNGLDGSYLPTEERFHARMVKVNLSEALLDGKITIETWFKRDSSHAVLGDALVSFSEGYRLQFKGGRFGFYANDARAENASFTMPAEGIDDGWHHVVAIFNTAISRNELYLDGEMQELTYRGPPGVRGERTDHFYIGGLARTYQGYNDVITKLTFRFAGSIEDFALYNTLLTEAQIKTHYQVGLREH